MEFTDKPYNNEPILFKGWIEHIDLPNAFSHDFTVANYKDANHKAAMIAAFKERRSRDYPIVMKFEANIKSGAALNLDGVNVGDKVAVRFCISGLSGYNKKNGNYYCINKLNVCKRDGVTIINKSQHIATPVEENSNVPDYNADRDDDTNVSF